ncbi:hypothetical protein Ahy_A10g050402 [Arachis hypogaea]|uniref:Aminotransferase-like plant mobile domain-containing protein n=1 Tax=Arachis hypogaea TaxID=3818 RepID=A0A445B995_ARAHY|nr:hypothetical protein Ahy_A10g050402 [Arachis hypogaea]
MQVGLPIDGEPVSGTLRSWSKFHQRDIWQWCEKLLGEVPDGHVGTTKYNIKLKWLRSRLQQMPLDSPEEALVRYARCYIMYLLGGVLLPDKANNTVHVRYLPLLANYEAISTYSWGSAVLCWLYRGMCLATDYNVEGMSGSHPPVGRRRSFSVGDTAGSQMRPFEPSLLDGRRLSYAGADDVGEEAQPGHPRRDTRAPLCGTGGRLGHARHHH